MTPTPRTRPQRDAAWLWLRAMLMRGPVDSVFLRAAAEADGFSWRTVQRARASDPAIFARQSRAGWRWVAAMPLDIGAIRAQYWGAPTN